MNDVTVIVPVYNTSEYIDRCVSLVMRQSVREFSLLLIDGGSSDDSPKKCLAWARRDSRVSFVYQTGLKLGPARNLGVKMANTEYVTFYDSDDIWHEDYLRLMMEGTEDGKNDIVLCDIKNVHEMLDGTFEENLSVLRFPAGRLDLSKEWNLVNRARTFAWGKIYRRSLFDNYAVWEPNHAYEDVATTPYLVAKAKSIYHVPVALYSYLRNRKNSLMTDYRLTMDLHKSLSELVNRFKKENLIEKYYGQLHQFMWGQLCFLHRLLQKFSSVPIIEREQVEIATKKIVFATFPELEKLEFTSFFVEENQLLRAAVSHIVMDNKQFSNDILSADYVVVSSGYAVGNEVQGKVIQVNVLPQPFDFERASWDCADEIFRNIWQ